MTIRHLPSQFFGEFIFIFSKLKVSTLFLPWSFNINVMVPSRLYFSLISFDLYKLLTARSIVCWLISLSPSPMPLIIFHCLRVERVADKAMPPKSSNKIFFWTEPTFFSFICCILANNYHGGYLLLGRIIKIKIKMGINRN